MLTTGEVAARLEVSEREVRRLAARGVLSSRRIGGAHVFDPADVARVARQPRSPGRLWSARTAWAALELLNGRDTDLVDQPRTSRLRKRMRSLDPEQLHRLVTHRSAVHRFHASDRGALRLRQMVTPTGVSSLEEDHVARQFGLVRSGESRRVDGYTPGPLDDIVRRFRLVLDAGGNATVRVLPVGLKVDHLLGTLPVVAVDLMDSEDVRERSSGRDMLEGLTRAL